MTEIVRINGNGHAAPRSRRRLTPFVRDSLPEHPDWEHMARAYANVGLHLENHAEATIQEFDDIRGHVQAVGRDAEAAKESAHRSEAIQLQILEAIQDFGKRLSNVEKRLRGPVGNAGPG